MKTGCCHTSHHHKVENRTICLSPSCYNYMGHTTTYRDFTFLRRVTATGLFIFSALFTFEDYSKSTGEFKIPVADKVEAMPLTLENLAEELKRQEVLCAKEVFVQIRLESGNLTSFLTTKTNNMLGMRYPARRPTAACGIYLPGKDTIITGTQEELRKYSAMNNYAVYATWQDAVADYKLWQEFSFKVTDKYLEFL